MIVIITLEEGCKDNEKIIQAIEKKGCTITKRYAHFNIIEGNINANNAFDLLDISNKILDIEGVLAVEDDDTYYTCIETEEEIDLDDITDIGENGDKQGM